MIYEISIKNTTYSNDIKQNFPEIFLIIHSFIRGTAFYCTIAVYRKLVEIIFR